MGTNREIGKTFSSRKFVPIKSKINEPELRKVFEDFARLKWYFRFISLRPSFTPKSLWKPPKVNPSLGPFLSQVEK